MDREEHEPQAEMFADSWDRLRWVEHQADRIRVLCQPWSQLPEYATKVVVIDEAATAQGHLEFDVDIAWPPALPQDINFMIGNLVTDARSCLDMAIESIWNHYSLPRGSGVRVQFPLEDNFEQQRSARGMQRFLNLLDEQFVRVIERAQPNYADGLFDLPMNISALFISHLSNANKHRNITPVVFRSVLSSYGTAREGLRMHSVDDQSRQGVPPLRFRLDYDPARFSEEDARRFIAGLAPVRSTPLDILIVQRLVIAGQEIPLQPQRSGEAVIPWRASLDDLLGKVPIYVRLTLRNLNRVHHHISAGDPGQPFLDMHGDL